MRFAEAVDRFVEDWRAEGRMRSAHTERAYRACLELHAALGAPAGTLRSAA